MHNFPFTVTVALTASGLIWAEADVDGIAVYRVTPDGVEITGIEIFGHPDKGQATEPCYRPLSATDPLYGQIEAILLGRHAQEMADDALADDWAKQGRAA